MRELPAEGSTDDAHLLAVNASDYQPSSSHVSAIQHHTGFTLGCWKVKDWVMPDLTLFSYTPLSCVKT